jgi:hypothetical protein
VAESFRVPDAMRPGLELLATLEEPALNELRNVLEQNPDVLFSRQAAEVHAAKLQTLGREQAQTLLEAVVPLIYLMGSQGKHADALLKDIGAAMRRSGKAGGGLDQQGRLEKNLSRILSDSSLVVAAKALSVATDCPRLFTSARILSDIRPIFGDEASQAPLGAVITHTLRVTYAETGTEKEFFVSLDSRDLATLQDQIKRALQKDSSLRAFVEKSKLKIYETS